MPSENHQFACSKKKAREHYDKNDSTLIHWLKRKTFQTSQSLLSFSVERCCAKNIKYLCVESGSASVKMRKLKMKLSGVLTTSNKLCTITLLIRGTLHAIRIFQKKLQDEIFSCILKLVLSLWLTETEGDSKDI